MTRTTDFTWILGRLNTLAVMYGTDDLKTAASDCTAAADGFTEAVDRIELAVRDGLAGTSYDGPGSHGGSSSPIERLLVGPLGPDDTSDDGWTMTPDTAAASLAELDTALRHLIDKCRHPRPTQHRLIRQDARTIWRIVNQWRPRNAQPRDTRDLSAANTAATECHMTRTNLGLYAPVHVPSDLYGLLPNKVPVSRWVHRFAKDHRRLPSPMEWKRHASTDDDLRKQLIGAAGR